MEEPSAVEEPTIFVDAVQASTTTADLVNDEATDSTTSSAYFISQDEITRTTDDLVNHLNAPNDAQIEMKPHTPHIKFIDMNDENRFLVVIFVDLATEQEERLLQKEKRLDSNSFKSIVDRKVKLHAYLFSLSNFSEKFKKNQKYVFLFFVFIKIKM